MEILKDIFLKITRQPHLADALDHTQPDGQPVARSLTQAQLLSTLIRASVPPRPLHYVRRPLQLEKLKRALENLKDPGWVILHGLGGCGKTTLAAECLRENPHLVSEQFGRELEFIKFNSELVVTLGTLHGKIARRNSLKTEVKFKDVDSAVAAVRELIRDKYPYMLLILDDVWSKDVIRNFDDLGCKILATTRNPVLFKVANYPRTEVPVEPLGFEPKEARSVLAQCVGCSPEDLPIEADEIFKLSGGLPLMISIIGSLIAQHRDRLEDLSLRISVKFRDLS